MFVLKIACSRAEWSELPFKTQSFETVPEKYTSSDVSTILFTDEKDRPIYSAHTENPIESPTELNVWISVTFLISSSCSLHTDVIF